MDTKKLRQKILDLAIHGKLVPQDPNDEPASVLLDRIRAEKEKLIKEGKIKAPKKSKSAGDTSHYGKEGPWALPEGWVWTTLDTIARFSGGKTPSMNDRSNWENGKHLWITSKDMKLEAICDSLIKLSDTGLQGMTIQHPGTILMVNRSGILRRTLPLGVLQKDATINQDLKSIIPYIIDLTPYLFFCLKAFEPIILQDYKKAGTTVDNINFDLFVTISIPLPPIQEQGRIVQSIQSWMKRIVVIEESNDEIFDTIDSTKSKILELAIKGKLVPQDPSDEPALDLIKRINPGFQPSHNLHYKEGLPSGWEYATLGEISDYGHCVSVPTDEIAETEWVLEMEDIEKDTGRLLKKVIKSERAISGSRHVFYKGQVLYSKLRTYLNKVFVADDCGFCTTEIIPITPKDGITAEYLNMYLRSPFFLAYAAQCGYGVKMPRLGTSDARKAIVPVPPTMEQHRIVTVTKQLFAQIDALAVSLS